MKLMNNLSILKNMFHGVTEDEVIRYQAIRKRALKRLRLKPEAVWTPHLTNKLLSDIYLKAKNKSKDDFNQETFLLVNQKQPEKLDGNEEFKKKLKKVMYGKRSTYRIVLEKPYQDVKDK